MPGKITLQPLTIEAYDDRERTVRVGAFKAPFNPATMTQNFGVHYEAPAVLGGLGGEQRYQHTPSGSLHFTIVLDNSPAMAANDMTPAFARASVTESVRQFLDLAYHVNGETHEPRYLTLRWGGFDGGNKLNASVVYRCRLSHVEINYNRFAPTGEPTSAELDVVLLSDEPPERRGRAHNLSSPDLTHSVVVEAGDTLPLLCQRIYGDPAHYVQVAQANNLNGLRSLQPGQVLRFPPIVEQKRTV